MTAFTLRVFHPSVDPRTITEALGLPPTTSWAADGDQRESYWQTQLAGNETADGGVDAGLRDIAARFAHYRFFVDAIRAGGGRVEIAVSGGGAADATVAEMFRGLMIGLVFE
ncbi:MAG: hypothetical protein WDM91_00965 [Rhizomicrobium sp.]